MLALKLNHVGKRGHWGAQHLTQTSPVYVSPWRWPLGAGSRGWFNIMMPSNQPRNSHYEDKTTLLPSRVHNRNSYTGKTTLSDWIRAQDPICIICTKFFTVIKIHHANWMIMNLVGRWLHRNRFHSTKETCISIQDDDVMTWRRFPRYCFLGDSPHKRPVILALMFPIILA